MYNCVLQDKEKVLVPGATQQRLWPARSSARATSRSLRVNRVE